MGQARDGVDGGLLPSGAKRLKVDGSLRSVAVSVPPRAGPGAAGCRGRRRAVARRGQKRAERETLTKMSGHS